MQELFDSLEKKYIYMIWICFLYKKYVNIMYHNQERKDIVTALESDSEQ